MVFWIGLNDRVNEAVYVWQDETIPVGIESTELWSEFF